MIYIRPETRLIIGIISQAVKDVDSTDTAVRYSAITFFYSEQYQTFLDFLGLAPDMLPVIVEALS
jgi:hypothetical protein